MSETIVISKKIEYEDALKKSGYKAKLKYTTKTTAESNKSRQRNTMWFNPPFNKIIKTNVAKILFRLLDKHFPAQINCTKSSIITWLKYTMGAWKMFVNNKKNATIILAEKSPNRDQHETTERKTIVQ